jgi:hypothetical protein
MLQQLSLQRGMRREIFFSLVIDDSSDCKITHNNRYIGVLLFEKGSFFTK